MRPGAEGICEARGLVARRGEWLRPSIAIALAGLVVSIIEAIPGSIPYFQSAEVIYSTEELATYPMAYRDNKLIPDDIQGKAIVDGPVKILCVVVRNKGQRSASDVLVRIPLSSRDEYIAGWMSKSEAPSVVYMLGARTEYTFHKLLPGDAVSFYLYLRNVNSDLTNRIEVFDGDGYRAAYYRYVPVRYVGSDGVIKRWFYVLGLASVVILLVHVSRTRKPKQTAISAPGQSPADAREHPPASTPGSTARDETSRDRPPDHSTAGRR